MKRRGFLWLGLCMPPLRAGERGAGRGRLLQNADQPPALRQRDGRVIELAGERGAARGRLLQNTDPPAMSGRDGRVIELAGDAETVAVLRDERLKDEDFEARGEFLAPERMRIDPIHLRALFVHRQGKLLVVTYWCPVCAIRTYTPGQCGCCQEETRLDPRDPALADADPSKAAPNL
jgi:hypothetical protein